MAEQKAYGAAAHWAGLALTRCQHTHSDLKCVHSGQAPRQSIAHAMARLVKTRITLCFMLSNSAAYIARAKRTAASKVGG
jgi:hypothetical protein